MLYFQTWKVMLILAVCTLGVIFTVPNLMPAAVVAREAGCSVILVEAEAKVSLNEIRDLLEALEDQAYTRGFQDGLQSTDDRRNEAAERAYELPFRELGVGE
jgi:isopentenyl diphosphate isomerase/L-lactate dehydrogenase-like FMN-dependent dehydrogenase